MNVERQPIAPNIPTARQMLWPALRAVAALDGSARIDEIDQTTIELEQFTEEQQSVLHGDGPRTEIGYRLTWARTHLKLIGLLENSARGVWSLTVAGRTILDRDEDAVIRLYDDFLKLRKRSVASEGSSTRDDDRGIPEEAPTWQDQLLEGLVSLAPDRFERLSRLLLLEAGFASVNVTGRSGDEGIDGTGVFRQSLVSFPVFFQCKKYRGSVGPGAVRDFRGAMVGRGNHGLLITTGKFTNEARREATRDGAPPIDLIDGEYLCELLKQHEIGVTTAVVEQVEVDLEALQEI
jgi:restriction system protein